MKCLTSTTVAASESWANHFCIGFKQQPGAIGARIKKPDEHVPHWRVQTFQQDEPGLSDSETRLAGFRRVEIEPKEFKK
jgi:hypothetical protein